MERASSRIALATNRSIYFLQYFQVNNVDVIQGLGVGPMLFSCKISPRTAEKAAIVERELIEAEDIFLRFEFGLSPEDQEFVAKSRVRSQ
jgi:hypothetical protein